MTPVSIWPRPFRRPPGWGDPCQYTRGPLNPTRKGPPLSGRPLPDPLPGRSARYSDHHFRWSLYGALPVRRDRHYRPYTCAAFRCGLCVILQDPPLGEGRQGQHTNIEYHRNGSSIMRTPSVPSPLTLWVSSVSGLPGPQAGQGAPAGLIKPSRPDGPYGGILASRDCLPEPQESLHGQGRPRGGDGRARATPRKMGERGATTRGRRQRPRPHVVAPKTPGPASPLWPCAMEGLFLDCMPTANLVDTWPYRDNPWATAVGPRIVSCAEP